VVATNAPVIVRNAGAEPRFAAGDWLQGPNTVGAYLGYPIENGIGAVLGSLSVIDAVPRDWTTEEIDAAAMLGRQVIAQVELRRAAQENAELWALHRSLELELESERAARMRAITAHYDNGICQDLAGLLYLISSRSHESSAIADHLALVKDLIREMLLRYSSAEHRSVEIASRNLKDALKELAQSVQAGTGVHCTVQWLGTIDIRNRRHAEALFRIAESAVARASTRPWCRHIAIRVRPMNGRVVLDITDEARDAEGSVFPDEANWIELMRFKASAIPARLDILPRTAAGGRVRCVLFTSLGPIPRFRSTQ
jgi:signal transduction histidine kinase